MLYVIKFIYSFVLPPGIFILLLAGICIWIWKKQRKASLFLLGITLLLYLSMTSLVSNALIGSLERQYSPPAQLQGDVIVVLGGGATQGTPDIGGLGNVSGAAGNRLITAVQLYRQTGLPIIVSGGQVFSDSGNEADIARRQLVGMGVAAEDIVEENRSLNTEQNAVNTAAIMQQRQWTHPILITSAFHMPRSVMEFERAGLQVDPYPSDYWVSRPGSFYPGKLSPSSSAMNAVSTAAKEYTGMLAVKIKSL